MFTYRRQLGSLKISGYFTVFLQIRMTQEVANFFVSEARRNMHQASSISEEDKWLIYNWIPHFTGETIKRGVKF